MGILQDNLWQIFRSSFRKFSMSFYGKSFRNFFSENSEKVSKVAFLEFNLKIYLAFLVEILLDFILDFSKSFFYGVSCGHFPWIFQVFVPEIFQEVFLFQEFLLSANPTEMPSENSPWVLLENPAEVLCGTSYGMARNILQQFWDWSMNCFLGFSKSYFLNFCTSFFEDLYWISAGVPAVSYLYIHF